MHDLGIWVRWVVGAKVGLGILWDGRIVWGGNSGKSALRFIVM